MESTAFRLGLPKGRFLPFSLAVLDALGAPAAAPTRKASWTVRLPEGPLTAKLLKVQDIAFLLGRGDLDGGVVPDEWMVEMDALAPAVSDLGWCRTQIVFATPRLASAGSNGYRVATPFPALARRFDADLPAGAEIVPVWGCPEALVPDVCDGIVDCTETGRSLDENDLVVRARLLESSVRLFVNTEAALHPLAQAVERILDEHRVADAGREPELVLTKGG